VSPWWNGRCVAFRPDVPAGLNVDDLCLIRTDEERAIMHERIDAAVAAGKDDPWPSWLAPPVAEPLTSPPADSH
jgi:hypothetical protein